MKETVKLKEEALQAWLAQGYPEAAGSFQMAKRGMASVVAEAKTRLWEEFWQTVRQQKGKQD